MYYIKLPERPVNGVIGITRRNVFCLCPGCGKEVQVDLQQFAGNQGFRFEGSSVLCSDCTLMEIQKEQIKALTHLKELIEDNCEEDEENDNDAEFMACESTDDECEGCCGYEQTDDEDESADESKLQDYEQALQERLMRLLFGPGEQ